MSSLDERDLRLPKQFGDFSESLVMYILGLNNWSVALIDNVGADVIAVSIVLRGILCLVN